MKNNIDFNVEELFAIANTNGMVVFNPLTNEVVKKEFMVEILSMPITGNEIDVVNFILVNIDTISKTDWYVVIFCGDSEDYEIGLMYATDVIENAMDTAKRLGENRVYSKHDEYIKAYSTSHCITEVQERLARREWIDNYKLYKRI